MQAQVLRAMGEPNRLQIVELLRLRPYAVGEIVDALDLRQPQVSKHLRVLAECGIVRAEVDERRRIYRLESEPFSQLARWVESFEHVWELRLDSLGDYLRAGQTEEGRR